MKTTADLAEFPDRLAELVRQVQLGNEVVFTDGQQPVARLVASTVAPAKGTDFRVESIAGHRVLTPNISQSELADEIFDGR